MASARTVSDAIASARDELARAACATPRLDAEVLLAEVIGSDRAQLIADARRELTPAEEERFQAFIARRVEHEPVAYITGHKAFRALELAVDRRVMIPRPESEHVVEAALELPAGTRVCDVGAGSGAIALALKQERPDLDVIATDNDLGALEVARANARRLGIDVRLYEADLLPADGGPIEAIVANPPYVRDDDRQILAPEITHYEPPQALFAGPDGLDVLRRLATAAGESGATFVATEVGIRQAEAVAELLRAAGFAEIETVRDLAGIERVVVARR